jgi:hypothetical protein
LSWIAGQGRYSFWAIGIPERLGELAAEVEALVWIDAVEPLVGLEQNVSLPDVPDRARVVIVGRQLDCDAQENRVL